jgi:hypothetical protein
LFHHFGRDQQARIFRNKKRRRPHTKQPAPFDLPRKDDGEALLQQ